MQEELPASQRKGLAVGERKDSHQEKMALLEEEARGKEGRRPHRKKKHEEKKAQTGRRSTWTVQTYLYSTKQQDRTYFFPAPERIPEKSHWALKPS